MEIYPVVIVGAGPAGLSAAMQLCRQGQQAVILEGDRPGGLLWNANLVENYPGFEEGISGPDLANRFLAQAERLGVKVGLEEVEQTRFEEGLFRVGTTRRELACRYLVAASGTKPRPLMTLSPALASSGRVQYEVYPLLDCQGEQILIVGAGDAAFDYALNLSRHNQVIILNRGSEIKSLPLLVERARSRPSITYLPQTEISEIALDDQGRLEVRAVSGEAALNLRADYLIPAIGREPDTSFAGPGIMEEADALVREKRLFLIGDLASGPFRQTAIAVGEGIRSAMLIGNLLRKGPI